MNDTEIRLRGPVELADTALTVARRFIVEFPDRVGDRRGVIYATSARHHYVYRTPRGVVVVLSEALPIGDVDGVDSNGAPDAALARDLP